MEADSDGMGCGYIKGWYCVWSCFRKGVGFETHGYEIQRVSQGSVFYSFLQFFNYAMPLPSMSSIQIPLSKAKHQP